MSTQLRCRFAPEIFLIRDSGLLSIAPNLLKSTLGQGSKPSASPLPVVAAAGPAVAPLITPLPNFWTSSWRIRSFGPVPFTRDRSTPSSRANARTEGEACALLKLAESTGAGAGSAADTGAGVSAAVAGAGV